MIDFGNFTLVTAWIISLLGFVLGVFGALKKNQESTASAINATYITFILTTSSLISLSVSFVKHNYKYLYVWQHSNNEMPWYYLISAVWGGMDGSMLLWAFLVCLFSSIACRKISLVPKDLGAWVVPILNIAANFFLLVIVFLTNPFRLVPEGSNILNGNGLNPLLQNPSMLIHPPMLYLGFTSFIIPFAFCFAALLSGNLKDHWIIFTRRFTLIAWGFLTTGIILGGNWAYIELGWGGFWAWDPVENASFLPWLSGTAFIHSVMVQEKKGMLKVWNASLCILTYLLTVFGTFLTRSGIVQSVHAFAETDVGWVFLAYMGIILVTGITLIAYRYKELQPERMLESYFCREAAFLFNNLILLSICFATFWGVMYPVFSEAVTGQKSVVGPPFFNQVNVPLFLMLIFLMGVGPLIAWTKNNFNVWLKTFITPFIFGLLLSLFFLWLNIEKYYQAISFGLCLFVILTIESEFRRAIVARREMLEKEQGQGVFNLIRKKPRRYGGLIVHLGVAIITIAITASMGFKTEKDISLKKGEEIVVGRYLLQLEALEEKKFPNYVALISKIKVSLAANKEFLTYLNPERRMYLSSEEMTSEVDMRITPRDDLYIALTGTETQGLENETDINKIPAMLKVFINPLQIWLWFGALIMLLGAVIVIGPNLQAVLREEVELEKSGVLV